MTQFRVGGPARFQHQKRGLRKMIDTKGVTALLFDPGLGKSATVIDFAGLLALTLPKREAKVLVIAPLSAVDTWVKQAHKFASPQVSFWSEAVGGGTIRRKVDILAHRGERPFWKPYGATRKRDAKQVTRALGFDQAIDLEALQADGSGGHVRVNPAKGPSGLVGPRVVMEVLNIDSFSQRQEIGSKTMADVVLAGVLRFAPDLVVVDESHLIKGRSSNASRLVSRIGDRVPRRVILTGTLMPHSPLDVFAQWRFLEPTAFGKVTSDGRRTRAKFSEFENRYAEFGGWGGQQAVRFKNLGHMQRIMAKNAVVARKEDSLDLPETTDAEVSVVLSSTEAREYAAMKKDLATRLDTGEQVTAASRLTQMMRLRQITAGHLKDDQGLVHIIGDSKVRTIASLVHDTLGGEKRLVVFAHFRPEISAIARALKKKGTEVLEVTGDTASEQRTAIRNRFGSDDPTRLVLVAQIRTMSLAVNELVTASHAVFASLPQQRDVYVQARDRLNRMGQTRPVTFWHVVVPGTIDTVILRSHRQRTSVEAAVLAHIRDDDAAEDVSDAVEDDTA